MTHKEKTALVRAVAVAMRSQPASAATTALHAIAFHITDDYPEFDILRQTAYDVWNEESARLNEGS